MENVRYSWDYFFTITLKTDYRDDSWNKQRSYFETFINSIQHHTIVSVLELQLDGTMHIHSIISFMYNENDNVDFRKYFFKMKRKVKQLGTADFQVMDDYCRCMSYCFKDVHKGYIKDPIIIDDYNKMEDYPLLIKIGRAHV